MALLEIMKYKMKSAIRTRELYIYIIGFPMIFLIIYGSLAATTYAAPNTIQIGVLNLDQGTSINIGDKQFYINYGEEFQKYLDELKYEGTDIKIFEIRNVTSREEGEKLVSKLEIATVIYIDEEFSNMINNYSKSITYLTLTGVISSKMEEAYKNGNTTLGDLYLAALSEVQSLGNYTANISLDLMGDPTYSDSSTAYELMWKYFIAFIFETAEKYTKNYTEYLEVKYRINLIETFGNRSSDFSSSIRVNFVRIGGGSAKETFAKMYYSILVPGQIIQSIMVAAVAAIYMIGYELERGIIHRVKLTKISSSGYIGGTLLSWGGVALFQSLIFILAALALGYIEVGGNPINYILAIIILTMAGILTAAFSIIIVSFVSEKIAAPIAMITLITVSLYIAGYFPITNPVIGDFMGRKFTQLDLIPWRAGITGLRKALMLSKTINPVDVLPDLTLLAIWTTLYTVIAFTVFEKMKMRKRR